MTPLSMMSAFSLGRYNAPSVPTNCSSTTYTSSCLYGARYVRARRISMSVLPRGRGAADAVEHEIRDLVRGQRRGQAPLGAGGAEGQGTQREGGGCRVDGELVRVRLEEPGQPVVQVGLRLQHERRAQRDLLLVPGGFVDPGGEV